MISSKILAGDQEGEDGTIMAGFARYWIPVPVKAMLGSYVQQFTNAVTYRMAGKSRSTG
jgi:hypothetical protein